MNGAAMTIRRVIRNVVIHITNEQPLLADLFTIPAASDVGLVCTNIRTMDGKRPIFIDRSDATFFFPYLHIRFIEIPAAAVQAAGAAATLAPLAVGNGRSDAPNASGTNGAKLASTGNGSGANGSGSAERSNGSASEGGGRSAPAGTDAEASNEAPRSAAPDGRSDGPPVPTTGRELVPAQIEAQNPYIVEPEPDLELDEELLRKLRAV